MAKLILAFSFGKRGVEPGKSNEALAEKIRQLSEVRFIFTQWEIGKALIRFGISPDHQVFRNSKKEGAYLDTREVARQMEPFVRYLRQRYNNLEVYVVAHNDHMKRVLRTLKKIGVDARAAPNCKNIPYDPGSDQIWTRSKLLFQVREVLAWPLYKFLGYV